MGKVTDILVVQKEMERIAHNACAGQAREAMAEAGWVNPDGIGMVYYHPNIVDSEGRPVVMSSHLALDIQEAWEGREKPSEEPAAEPEQ